MTLTILFHRGLILFPFTFFFYTSSFYKHKHNNTEPSGTSQDNKKPSYLAKQRVTLGQIQDCQDLVTHGSERIWNLTYLTWPQVTQEIN